MNNPLLPVIPETVTVHLGPPDSPAENITVSFPDYIKNVASSEIYPTWPEAALRANIYAQITYVLNRIYTEYYRSRGYDFDITNDTTFDQSFVKGRDVFENISQIVDEVFDSYIVRQGFVDPLFARYCDGVRTVCEGLSQWGSVTLAEEGLGAYDILTRYYGEDIDLRENVPIENISESAPPIALRFGSSGNDVRQIQLRLNRIARNYPSIPTVYPPDGFYDSRTEESVRAFQRIFNLTEDGIVGKATWYKLIYVANAVKRLNDTLSEGVRLEDVIRPFEEVLQVGSEGETVEVLQYLLQVIARFTPTIPAPPLDGIFGESTAVSVGAFQREWGLPETGIVDQVTGQRIFDTYRADLSQVPGSVFSSTARPYPGIPLRRGSTGEDVVYLQEYLNTIASVYPVLATLTVDGDYGEATERNVFLMQEALSLPQTGVVDLATWEGIARVYDTVAGGERPAV